MIPPEFIPQLLARTDIVEVVGTHVELKKAGASLKGLCPFHGEKSPSFFVTPSRQNYHCFGCGVHGDALKFLMEHLGMAFPEAVEELARRAGMQVPSDTRSQAERAQAEQRKVQQSNLSELLERAARHYRDGLRQAPAAIDYLKRRGVSGRIAADFGLGYAAAQWRGLSRCFPNYEDTALQEAGLVLHSEAEAGQESKRYDRFRDRLMFPIRNVAGAVIGFGGRVLDGSEPKYLNSPETPVFSKGQELYGLFEARSAIRRAGHALVVEGYMDVVALAQHGVAQAVATLGTACTSDQVAKLFRFTEQIVFSFDGDAAGRRAAARALQAVLPHLSERRSARFLFLPPEHDPDSFVREHGAAAFEALREQALPLSAQLIDVASAGCALDSPEGRARLLAQAKPLLALLPAGLLKRQLIGEMARLARVAEDELLADWQGPGAPSPSAPSAPRSATRPSARRLALRPPSADDQLLRLLLTHPSWWEQLPPDTHARLLSRPGAHAAVLAWLDRTVTEQGPLAWTVLRARLVADAAVLDSLQALEHLHLDRLDELAQFEHEPAELHAALERLERGAFFRAPGALLPREPS